MLKLVKMVLGARVTRDLENQGSDEVSIGDITYRYIWEKRDLRRFIMMRLVKRDAINQALYHSRRILKTIRSMPINYDIIHAHGMYLPPAGIGAATLGGSLNIPYVITLHGSDINLNMGGRECWYNSVMNGAAACIFVSRALLRRAKQFGYSGNNAFIIPNGYDPSIFYPMDKNQVRKELGIHRAGFKYIGFVGSLSFIKRADKLTKIFNEILKYEKKVKFILVGDGPLREKILKECRNIDLVITGYLPQKYVAKWMNAFDIMVLPSRNEGWPCVVLESHACGTPVIGSNNGGIEEAIGDKKFVVQEGKDFELRFATKIIELINNINSEEIKEVLTARAKEFTWERLIKKEIGVYEHALRKYR